jgi:hypothetical protein
MKGDDAHTMRWMTGSAPCEANFYEFAKLLGYPFDAPNATGHHLHTPGNASKDKLYELYDETGVLGTITGLLPFYDQLVRLFRENIAPSGGNNDAIRSALVNLLAHSHECAQADKESEDFQVDVMDYIFHEMFDAMVSRTSIPYAPYIMLLIQGMVTTEDLSVYDLVEHLVKKPYVKRKNASTTTTAAPASGSFMGDACASGTTHGLQTSSPHIKKKVKKLNWFQ